VYPLELRQQAVQMFVDVMKLRRNARHLNVNHQSVANWVKQHAEYLPIPPVPEEVETAELDEVFSFIGNKKTHLYLDDCRQKNTLFLGFQGGLGTQ
jgi:transposase-like protein